MVFDQYGHCLSRLRLSADYGTRPEAAGRAEKETPPKRGVEGDTGYARAGRTTFPTYYDIVSTDDEGCEYADGQAIMVWTDRASGVSRPVPEELRALLA